MRFSVIGISDRCDVLVVNGVNDDESDNSRFVAIGDDLSEIRRDLRYCRIGANRSCCDLARSRDPIESACSSLIE